LIFITNRV